MPQPRSRTAGLRSPLAPFFPGLPAEGRAGARPSLRLPRGPGRATRAPWLRPAHEPPRHQRTAGCAPLLPRCLGVGVASRRVGASGTQTCSRAPCGSPSAPPTQLLLLWIRTLDTADGRVTGAPRVPRQPLVPGGRDGTPGRARGLAPCGPVAGPLRPSPLHSRPGSFLTLPRQRLSCGVREKRPVGAARPAWGPAARGAEEPPITAPAPRRPAARRRSPARPRGPRPLRAGAARVC